jgi:TetR/AcrR family transcriptional regulator, mexCD-oprJ operon repressor
MTKKDTREILLDAAISVFSKNPGAPFSDVADSAGVGRATLYRHFPSRDDLMRELVLGSYQQMNAALEPILAQNLTGSKLLLAILEIIIPLGDRYYFLLLERSFENDPEINRLQKQDEKEWRELVQRLKAEKVIAKEIPDAWVTSTLESLIYAAWESVHEGYIARREAPKLVYHTLISGLGCSVNMEELPYNASQQ